MYASSYTLTDKNIDPPDSFRTPDAVEGEGGEETREKAGGKRKKQKNKQEEEGAVGAEGERTEKGGTEGEVTE